MGQWQWAAKGLLTAACAAISERGLSSGPLVLQGSGQKETSGRWRDGGEVSQLSGRALDPVHHQPLHVLPRVAISKLWLPAPKVLEESEEAGVHPPGTQETWAVEGEVMAAWGGGRALCWG